MLERSRLSARVAFVSATAVREARLDAGAGGLELALTTSAQQATTRTATFALVAGAPLRTSLAGGFAERPVERVYSPTFWPAVDWITVGGTAILLRQSTGVRFGAGGTVELMVVRDARNEQCDIEGGTGSDPDSHRIEWFVERAASPADAARAAQAWNRPVVLAAAGASDADADRPLEESLISIDGDGVISALKPAERGDGVIVRVLLEPGPATLHLSPLLAGRTQMRTDAVERDLDVIGPPAATITLDRSRFGSIATLRLR